MIYKIKLTLIRLFQIILYPVPLKKNRIMFYAHNRKGYVCNPAALMEFIRKNMPDKYELIWVTGFPESCEKRKNIMVVRLRSFSYFRFFVGTKYMITNDMIDEALVKKTGQVFLTTWHGGGAYKKVGNSTLDEDAAFARKFKLFYGRLDYFVSSCRKCTEMYAEAFGLPRQKFLETGTPRNDIFFHPREEIRRRVCDFYGLPKQTRILLFAPSFQLSAPEKERYAHKELIQLAERLQKISGMPWVVLYRHHYFCTEENPGEHPLLRDGNAYYEMQDLLYTADVLVTDFSSCIWDFSLTGRPIVLLENRLQEYAEKDRGFFIPYETWPYLKADGLRECADLIAANLKKDFSSVYKKHQEEMGSFETGGACEKIMNLVFRNDDNNTHK